MLLIVNVLLLLLIKLIMTLRDIICKCACTCMYSAGARVRINYSPCGWCSHDVCGHGTGLWLYHRFVIYCGIRSVGRCFLWLPTESAGQSNNITVCHTALCNESSAFSVVNIQNLTKTNSTRDCITRSLIAIRCSW